MAVSLPDLNARLFIHPFLAIAALVLAARWYLRAAIVVLAAYILAALAIGWSLDFALGFVALPSANLLLGMIPLILFTMGS